MLVPSDSSFSVFPCSLGIMLRNISLQDICPALFDARNTLVLGDRLITLGLWGEERKRKRKKRKEGGVDVEAVMTCWLMYAWQ